MYREPIAYFITFRTYGTWLHGDVRGSVDPDHNEFGTPVLQVDPRREADEVEAVGDRVVELSGAARVVVEKTIREVCEHKGWKIRALNVRTNHVHVVVAATSKPEMVMNALKAWSTRRLVEAGMVERRARVWTRHGSTVYLFTPEKLAEKCDYVINQQ